MQEYILSSFYDLSQLLLLPTILSMVIASIWLLFQAGLALRHGIDRYLLGRSWRLYVDDVRKRRAPAGEWAQHAKLPLHRWVAQRCERVGDLDILVKDVELLINRRLGKLQVLVRTGPMLGLVGTLLPLGPALESLSSSDIKSLGEHMNTAFTMTVFGILIGALAYGLFVLYRQWGEQDLAELELIHASGSNQYCFGLEVQDGQTNKTLAS